MVDPFVLWKTGCHMPPPTGFEWTQRKNGDVVITHGGRLAGILRGKSTAAFIASLENHDAQELMARTTGNYKRGNERQKRDRPNHRR
jgi:hypothetical protein